MRRKHINFALRDKIINPFFTYYSSLQVPAFFLRSRPWLISIPTFLGISQSRLISVSFFLVNPLSGQTRTYLSILGLGQFWSQPFSFNTVPRHGKINQISMKFNQFPVISDFFGKCRFRSYQYSQSRSWSLFWSWSNPLGQSRSGRIHLATPGPSPGTGLLNPANHGPG